MSNIVQCILIILYVSSCGPNSQVNFRTSGKSPAKSENVESKSPKNESQQKNKDLETVLNPLDTPFHVTRRLSGFELSATVGVVFGESKDLAKEAGIEDIFTPFDNNTHALPTSSVFITRVERFSNIVAQSLLADKSRLEKILPCKAEKFDDVSCFKQSVTKIGSLLLRRPLSTGEKELYTNGSLQWATKAKDFNFGIRYAVQSFLQHPEFLYRFEFGTSHKGSTDKSVQLSQFEIASRLSFLIWGSGPDETLFQAAEAKELQTSEQIRRQAKRLLKSEKAQIQVSRIHTQWLGFDGLKLDDQALAKDFQTESSALISKVIFQDNASWKELFTSSESYINKKLADHYGIQKKTDEFAWTKLDDSRMGLLSHGGFFAGMTTDDITSITGRGVNILEKLLCTPPPPPPEGVDGILGDITGLKCKSDIQKVHSTNASCASCHAIFDPIGQGLESFDNLGRFRTSEFASPICEVDSHGALPSRGDFSGPKELAKLLVNDDRFTKCFSEHLFHYSVGRDLVDEDEKVIRQWHERFKAVQFNYQDLIISIVSDASFRQVSVEEGT